MADSRLRKCGGAIGRCRVEGFTLVELMVTVAVLAIVAAIATPSFGRMISHNRLVAGGNEMVAAIQAARSEAIARRATTTFCATSDGQTCSGASGNRWLVLATKNGVSTVVRSAEVNPALTVTVSPNVAAGNARISFTPAGFVQVGGRTSGTVAVCAPSLPNENSFDVSASMVRVASAKRAAGAGCRAPGDI